MAYSPVENASWANVRNQIVDELESVEGVLLVHNRIRWDKRRNTNEERFKKLHTPRGKTKINSITVSRLAQERQFFTQNEFLAQTLVSIHFWYELYDEDDTQAAFDTITDNILTQFEEPLRLDSTVEIIMPIQLIEEDVRWLAGSLVHHAEFHLTVQERIRQNTFR